MLVPYMGRASRPTVLWPAVALFALAGRRHAHQWLVRQPLLHTDRHAVFLFERHLDRRSASAGAVGAVGGASFTRIAKHSLLVASHAHLHAGRHVLRNGTPDLSNSSCLASESGVQPDLLIRASHPQA